MMLKLYAPKTQTAGLEMTAAASAVVRTRLLEQPKWSSWLFVAVFVISSLVTLIFLRVLPGSVRLNEQSDYYGFYEPVARSILAGRGFSSVNENPATDYPPGYPLTLAGVFELCHWLNVPEEVGLSAVAVLGMALVSVFVFLLTRTMWGALPALVASLVWMTYPFALWLTKQPNSEIPFMVVFYGGLCLFWYALIRKSYAWTVYFCCGLLFGLAMLIRPMAIGIPFVLGLVIWLVGREMTVHVRLLLVTVLLFGNLVAVLPWEAWVSYKTGKVILLSTNGVKAIRDGVTFAVETKGYRESGNVPSSVVQVMDDIRAHESEIATFGDITSVIYREFRSHPVAVTELLLLKIARSWYGTDSQRRELPILLIQLAYFIPTSWGSWKAWQRGGIHRKFVISALLIVVYFWGMTFLALSILRYMVPVLGLLFVLIGGCYPQKLQAESLKQRS